MVANAKPFDRNAIRTALESSRRTEGSTHNFYLYPARFSPEAAATVILSYTDRNDWILDPFMGGGTAVVEGLMAGRRVVGADLNALGHFVATVRTTPLSGSSKLALRRWAAKLAEANPGYPFGSRVIVNLPRSLGSFAAAAIERAKELRFPREHSFARCALLRLGQWALDCRESIPASRELGMKLPEMVSQMLIGLEEFVQRCREAGTPGLASLLIPIPAAYAGT